MVPKSIIHLLIQYGTPILKEKPRFDPNFGKEDYKHINFYGACLNTSVELAREALDSIWNTGIDYEKCGGYYDDSGSTFEGTDDEPGTLSFIRCDIVTGEGETYRFAAESSITNLCDFVCKISDNPPNFENAIQGLEERINQNKDCYKYSEFKIK